MKSTFHLKWIQRSRIALFGLIKLEQKTNIEKPKKLYKTTHLWHFHWWHASALTLSHMPFSYCFICYDCCKVTPNTCKLYRKLPSTTWSNFFSFIFLAHLPPIFVSTQHFNDTMSTFSRLQKYFKIFFMQSQERAGSKRRELISTGLSLFPSYFSCSSLVCII